jgi:hypothetical protein
VTRRNFDDIAALPKGYQVHSQSRDRLCRAQFEASHRAIEVCIEGPKTIAGYGRAQDGEVRYRPRGEQAMRSTMGHVPRGELTARMARGS